LNPDIETRVIIYRSGNLTADNFTPRPGKDTAGKPGQKPGLSLSERSPPGRKVQSIDIRKLKPPLRAFPDDVAQGGTPGHIAIAPVDEKGEVDIKLLEAWAAERGSSQIHELTQNLLDAVVEPDVRSDNP
jgi:hypothetical protein